MVGLGVSLGGTEVRVMVALALGVGVIVAVTLGVAVIVPLAVGVGLIEGVAVIVGVMVGVPVVVPVAVGVDGVGVPEGSKVTEAWAVGLGVKVNETTGVIWVAWAGPGANWIANRPTQ